MLNSKLCFVSPYDGRLVFTSSDVGEVWGDDWDDAPYEHNCGDPYNNKDCTYKLYTLYLYIPVNPNKYADTIEILTPMNGYLNSPYSVEDINKKKVPWIRINRGCEEVVSIFAGETLSQVLKKLNNYGIIAIKE